MIGASGNGTAGVGLARPRLAGLTWLRLTWVRLTGRGVPRLGLAWPARRTGRGVPGLARRRLSGRGTSGRGADSSRTDRNAGLRGRHRSRWTARGGQHRVATGVLPVAGVPSRAGLTASTGLTAPASGTCLSGVAGGATDTGRDGPGAVRNLPRRRGRRLRWSGPRRRTTVRRATIGRRHRTGGRLCGRVRWCRRMRWCGRVWRRGARARANSLPTGRTAFRRPQSLGAWISGPGSSHSGSTNSGRRAARRAGHRPTHGRLAIRGPAGHRPTRHRTAKHRAARYWPARHRPTRHRPTSHRTASHRTAKHRTARDARRSLGRARRTSLPGVDLRTSRCRPLTSGRLGSSARIAWRLGGLRRRRLAAVPHRISSPLAGPRRHGGRARGLRHRSSRRHGGRRPVRGRDPRLAHRGTGRVRRGLTRGAGGWRR
jgi:hypothetical protein